MKLPHLCLLLAVIMTSGFPSVGAQTNNTPTPQPPSATEIDSNTLDKRSKPILEALNLNNRDKEAKVREILAQHLMTLNSWHNQNDAQIKALWNDFNESRTKQDEPGANAALSKIDTVYASFKPQHDKFLSNLSTVLTPEQVEAVKDALTVNKVKVTFNAYGEIFHGLTDEQKAFILKNLKTAREEAIDAGSMTEKSAFFKKYKIKIEAFLTTHGYDVKQSYREFVAKQKADEEAKKSVAMPSSETNK